MILFLINLFCRVDDMVDQNGRQIMRQTTVIAGAGYGISFFVTTALWLVRQKSLAKTQPFTKLDQQFHNFFTTLPHTQFDY
jgi:hypothetical protein